MEQNQSEANDQNRSASRRFVAVGDRALKALSKIFAPTTEIHVFEDLKVGHLFASVRVPRTHQLIVGLSWPLFRDVRNHLLEQQGRQLGEDFRVKYVKGPVERLAVETQIDPGSVHDIPLPEAPAFVELVLWPRPL